ncbi:MAG TPA: lipopolysaccharide biosynthesis protein RfbH [Patescibacteria group bacterium]|nr:lipopolysaccharide biosynthesis protein RfbH [Patescibacteria group bacterium]
MDEALQSEIIKDYQARFPKRDFVPGVTPIPINGKIFNEKEILNMVEAVLEGWWTEGHFAELFERRIAKWLGTEYAELTNSGSSANLLAVSALTSMKLGDRRLKPGDEVITVAAGFPTTINPLVQHNLIPVFVDTELGFYNPTFEKIAAAVSPKTRAIFIAHTLGNPYDLDKVKELCEKNNFWLIEDNCDALGAEFSGKKTGTFGHIATVSFYPAHHITLAEGGAVFTNNSMLHRVIRSIRDWGRDCWCKTGKDNTCGKRFCWQLGDLPYGYDHKFIYSEIGYNLKVTDMQAALGLAQLEKLDGFIATRRANFTALYEGLKHLEQFFILPKWLPEANPSWFGFLLTVREDAPFKRADIVAHLQQKKIATRYLFAGNVTRQPYFVERKIPHRIVGNLNNTDTVMDNTFWIGCFPGITPPMVDYMIESVKEFTKKYL